MFSRAADPKGTMSNRTKENFHPSMRRRGFPSRLGAGNRGAGGLKRGGWGLGSGPEGLGAWGEGVLRRSFGQTNVRWADGRIFLPLIYR